MKVLKWMSMFVLLFAFGQTVPGIMAQVEPPLEIPQGQTSPDDTASETSSNQNIAGSLSIPEEKMAALLMEYSTKSVDVCRKSVEASWAVATDVGNKEKEEEKENAVKASAKFKKEWHDKYWKKANLDDYKNDETARQLYFLKELGSAVLPPEKLALLSRTITKMSSVYNKATICPYDRQNCDDSDKDRLTLDPDITERMAHSRDFDELKYMWTQWHDSTGRFMRSDYKNYVQLLNEVAVGNNYANAAEHWKHSFEDPKFEENIDKLWLQIKPLYDALHTYMRYKLIAIYGDKIDRNDENMPAHLLGNMWAQSWSSLYDDTKPFENATVFDITAKMKELKWDAMKMFETSNEFYMSLGLPSNKMSYTGESIILKPTNRTIQCHASAWDFCDGKDFRIKMCTSVNDEDLVTVHHEMGHIQYYIQYKDLPAPFRGGANPGFHEAVGDTIALSVSNPKHLVKIGLLDSFVDSTENSINALYLEALKRIAFLPFGLLIDKWRWDVFSEKVPETDWNKHWWDLRRKYQKVTPPVARSETDFDPGAKFHVPDNSAYISYFVAHILEFSFYKSLCIEAGEYDPNDANKPLHTCDFYKSELAGKKLANGLKMGSSKHWSKALEAMTGDTELNANAILEYFKPLHDFLNKENKRLATEDEVRQIFKKYNAEAAIYANRLTNADWDKTTDLNNKTKEDIYTELIAENANFTKEQYNLHFRNLKPDDFADEKIRRQIKRVTNLGTFKLDEGRLREFTETVNEMVKIYNKATFCSYFEPNCTKELTLDPDITEIMANSSNYMELEYTWTLWHNSTGPLIRQFYKKYIDIYNEAAIENDFKDAGEMWRDSFEDEDLVNTMETLWKKLEPLYDELHQYVKNKLVSIYGDKVDPNSKTIPAHLLGNMWAQTWENLYARIKPFKNASNLDVTEALKKHNYTALKIFKESDRFYQSLGLESNQMSYTGKSIIEKPDPNERLIVCHASAWDFYDGKDFRIKMCTTVNQENFITVHHEMGHIQYFILYKDQPFLFREGANPGFHEAVGDLMALSVSNPNHLKKIDLLGDYKDTEEDNINALFKMALERVAFLPFGLLIDLYRYDLFSGKVKQEDWNKHWEELRIKYQKVHSPVPRDERHFDAGAKFHVAGDSQYISYFFAYILEFQMFESLCKASGQYDPSNPAKPLHKCDLDGSQLAGQRLRDGLRLGSSQHWRKTLKLITNGETSLRAEPILDYFKPLYEFLVEENKKASCGTATSSGKIPYIVGGFALLVAAVGAISYGIFHHNRK